MTNKILAEAEAVLQEVETFFEGLFKKVDSAAHTALAEAKGAVVSALTPKGAAEVSALVDESAPEEKPAEAPAEEAPKAE